MCKFNFANCAKLFSKVITPTYTPHDLVSESPLPTFHHHLCPTLYPTWCLAWSLICHRLKKCFFYGLLETVEWMGWMDRQYGIPWKFPENWRRSRDHLHWEGWTTGNSSISDSHCQPQTTPWASLGWYPRTPLKAFMVAWSWPSELSKCSPYGRKLLGWACFGSLALPTLEHSMFSNCCSGLCHESGRGSLETHSFGHPISE